MKKNKSKKNDVPGLAGLKQTLSWVDAALKKNKGAGLTPTESVCFSNKLQSHIEELENYLRGQKLCSEKEAKDALAEQALEAAFQQNLL